MRWAAWIMGGILVVAVAVVVADTLTLMLAVAVENTPEERLEPRPFQISELDKLGDRAALRPHMRRIVAEIEAGHVLGSQMDLHRADFDKADEIHPGKKVTTYWFFAHPQFKDQEYHPILSLSVQNDSIQDKFGHVFECHVLIPDW
jgi:hypothetical protein